MKSARLLSTERHPHLRVAFWDGDMTVAQRTEKDREEGPEILGQQQLLRLLGLGERGGNPVPFRDYPIPLLQLRGHSLPTE